MRLLSTASRPAWCSSPASSDSEAAPASSSELAGSSSAGVGQLEGGLGASYELGVQGAERALDPGVDAVQAGRGVGEVPGDERGEGDGQGDPAQASFTTRPPSGRRAPGGATSEVGSAVVRTCGAPLVTVS